jgi:hypothetical protein
MLVLFLILWLLWIVRQNSVFPSFDFDLIILGCVGG